MSDDVDWAGYYATQDGRAPRPLLLEALEVVGPAHGRRALDLGSGDGRDTIELLARGWSVLAIDPQPAATERVRRLVPEQDAPRLETAQVAFAGMTLPAADLAFASFSLPFTHPADFPSVWATVAASLEPDGWFVGTLFGEQDTYAARPDMTCHRAEEVDALLDGWDVRILREVHRDGVAFDGPKHWHVWEVVARR